MRYTKLKIDKNKVQNNTTKTVWVSTLEIQTSSETLELGTPNTSGEADKVINGMPYVRVRLS